MTTAASTKLEPATSPIPAKTPAYSTMVSGLVIVSA